MLYDAFNYTYLCRDKILSIAKMHIFKRVATNGVKITKNTSSVKMQDNGYNKKVHQRSNGVLEHILTIHLIVPTLWNLVLKQRI